MNYILLAIISLAIGFYWKWIPILHDLFLGDNYYQKLYENTLQVLIESREKSQRLANEQLKKEAKLREELATAHDINLKLAQQNLAERDENNRLNQIVNPGSYSNGAISYEESISLRANEGKRQ